MNIVIGACQSGRYARNRSLLQLRIRRSEISRLKENECPRQFEVGKNIKNVKNELTLHFGSATNERSRLGENAKI
jgi:hypothetical protein